METFYSLTPDLLGRLDSKATLRFFGQLLWAQARRRGVPITKIHFSLRENVPDGGIDAAVDADAFAGSDDVLVQRKHVLPGEGRNHCRAVATEVGAGRIVRGKNEINLANLGSGVRECLENGGRYVLVCFGASLGEDRTRTSEKNFKDCFEKCGFPDTRVEVWSQENLVGLFSNYPLCAWPCPVGTWATSNHMPVGRGTTTCFQPPNWESPNVNAWKRFRGIFAARMFAISGSWASLGLGKTRLVLEATRAEDLSPASFYVPHAEDFQKDRCSLPCFIPRLPIT